MKKSTHGRWGDMYYIDPEISVTCSGGINGKPKHKPINMNVIKGDELLGLSSEIGKNINFLHIPRIQLHHDENP